ncbi:MAG TPA: hypothetical protein VFA62_05960, partial [Acidimicrobiia bacterium]|nr:hypothetical protein [Acidimicrobiia bacterium]
YRLHEGLTLPRHTLRANAPRCHPDRGGVLRPANTILIIRSVIAALLAALAVANFVSGRVVFGVLFAALAVMNVVMTVTISRRRARIARRFQRFADRPGR